jgi:flagellar protein FlaG
MNVAAVQHLDGQTLAAAPLVVPAEKLTEQRELIQAVKAVNAAELFGQNSELTFVLDRETNRPTMRLIDRKTNEIIRQIPPEYLLRMAAELRELEKVA